MAGRRCENDSRRGRHSRHVGMRSVPAPLDGGLFLSADDYPARKGRTRGPRFSAEDAIARIEGMVGNARARGARFSTSAKRLASSSAPSHERRRRCRQTAQFELNSIRTRRSGWNIFVCGAGREDASAVTTRRARDPAMDRPLQRQATEGRGDLFTHRVRGVGQPKKLA